MLRLHLLSRREKPYVQRRRPRLPALGLLGAVMLAGCSMPKLDAHSGFLTDRADVTPKAVKVVQNEPRYRVPDSANAIVIIYNHGTKRPQVRENCAAYFNRVPDTLLALRNKRTFIFRRCSTATEPASRTNVGGYIYARMAEVTETINALRRAGVKSRHIFVAGHSAGGWTALMLKAAKPALFNGVIAFAPAFAGPRSEEDRFPWWRREARPRHIKEMTSAKSLPALVFAYEGDRFNRPQDLTFLTAAYPDSVKIVGYGCETARKHLILHYDCRATETTKQIAAFINARVRAAGSKTARATP